MTLAAFLKGLLGGRGAASTTKPPRRPRRGPAAPLARADLAWRDDTGGIPVPDWEATGRLPHAPAAEDGAIPFATHDAFWCGAARRWLDEMCTFFAKQDVTYGVMESPDFIALAALEPALRKATLGYAEDTKKRVLDALTDLARDDGYGKTPILVLDSVRTYYRYVSLYYSDDEARGGELSQSSGMFINDGYGHFVFVADENMRIVEPVIAHELTHLLVSHLPLPAWLNEGIAVNMERALCGHRPSETVQQLLERHRAHWNARTIQEFWSGKSWKRAGEGNELSYEMAATFVGLAARDWPRFAKFANAAHVDDAGEAAARAHLGHPLAHFVTSLLGDGEWAPNPASWTSGTERGFF